MSEDAPVVRCVGLTKHYGRHPALVDLDLAVRPGEVFGYLGPNGAGKTTTLRVVMGFLRPTRGRVEVVGLDSWRDSTQIHRRVGYLPGEPALYDRLTGRELLTFFGHLRGAPDLSYARNLAERFDLDLDRPIRALSKGNRQKVALVQAFMSRPELLVLDEPTSGLDPLMQQEFHALLKESAAAGQTVLLSSHILSEVQRVADRVGIIRAGHLGAVETLEALRAKAAHHVGIRFARPVPAEAFRAIGGLRDLTVHGDTLRCTAPQTALDAIVKAAARFEVLDFNSVEADLEETFLAYYDERAVHAA